MREPGDDKGTVYDSRSRMDEMMERLAEWVRRLVYSNNDDNADVDADGDDDDDDDDDDAGSWLCPVKESKKVCEWKE